MNARPIWTQSGTGPKFIRSRVNGALSTCMLYTLRCMGRERQLQLKVTVSDFGD